MSALHAAPDAYALSAREAEGSAGGYSVIHEEDLLRELGFSRPTPSGRYTERGLTARLILTVLSYYRGAWLYTRELLVELALIRAQPSKTTLEKNLDRLVAAGRVDRRVGRLHPKYKTPQFQYAVD